MEASEIESLSREHLPEIVEKSLMLTSLIDRTGSGRQFARFSADGEDGIVAMHYSLERPENGRFVAITQFLSQLGVPVPALHKWLEDQQLIWMEDLGSDDLLHFQNADWESVRLPLYAGALVAVYSLHHIRENSDLPEDLPSLEPPFDANLYAWEQGYFFEHFAANFSECPPEELKRISENDELRQLTVELGGMPRHLIHRDFQSSNIMIRDGRPWLIDYQGMRFGLPEYDLASLLFDPYVDLTRDQREELAQLYFGMKVAAGDTENFEMFRRRLDLCASQRLMQALGAYGNLGLNKGQPEFLEFIPAALSRLREIAIEREAIPSLSPVLSLKKSLLA